MHAYRYRVPSAKIGRRPAAAMACVSLAAFLVGCSTPRSAPEEAKEVPREGGTLRIVQEAPRSLDPRESDSVYESLPVNQIFDTLVTIDPSLAVKPGLAETWTISSDGKVYTFTLQPGVRFHDGGPVTAEDVIYSICRQLCPRDGGSSIASSYLVAIEGAREFAAGEREDVTGLEVVGERTLRIRLLEPYPSFLEVLAMDNLGIVPEKLVRRVGAEAYGKAPVGSGPFRLTEWAEDHLKLEANPDYYAGRPHLDAVEIQFLRPGENDFGQHRFDAGQVDVVEPPTESVSALSRDRTVQLFRYQELSLSFLGLNTRVPPLDRPWLRRAVAHAINRRAMVLDSPSVRREAVGILPPGIAGYSPEQKTLTYDPEEARRLLAEAGHPGGAGLPPIRLHNPSLGASAQRVIQQMREDLQAVGIRLEVIPVTWPEMGRLLDDRAAAAFLLGWVADTTDPDGFLRSLFESGGTGNYFGHESPETERLLELGTRERNPVRRARIYRELERHVLEEAPLVPLYHSIGVLAVRDHVQGLTPTPLGLAKVELEKVWFRQEEHGS